MSRYRTDEQLQSIRKVSIAVYGEIGLMKYHHWTRLVKCAKALERFNWDEEKAVKFLRCRVIRS